jgi:hypothetical protein
MARSDLVYEFAGNLNGSGVHTSGWIDTTDVQTVTVAFRDLGAAGGTSMVIQHSVDGSTMITESTISSTSTQVLYARYFKLTFSNGTANGGFHLSVRRAS